MQLKPTRFVYNLVWVNVLVLPVVLECYSTHCTGLPGVGRPVSPYSEYSSILFHLM
jgi:hypothetical protein